MNLKINGKYPVYVNNKVANEIEYAITKNTGIGTSEIVIEVGYFIRYLLKGIQSLTYQSELPAGDTAIYEIDNIGTVYFSIVEDKDNNIYIVLEDIRFDYYGYHPYSHLRESHTIYITKSNIRKIPE